MARPCRMRDRIPGSMPAHRGDPCCVQSSGVLRSLSEGLWDALLARRFEALVKSDAGSHEKRPAARARVVSIQSLRIRLSSTRML